MSIDPIIKYIEIMGTFGGLLKLMGASLNYNWKLGKSVMILSTYICQYMTIVRIALVSTEHQRFFHGFIL